MKAAFIVNRPVRRSASSTAICPAPRPRQQVRVKVLNAVSVNPIDTYVRAGIVAMDLPRPYIVGADLAGTVEAVGPEVRCFGRAIACGGATRACWAAKAPLPSMRRSKKLALSDAAGSERPRRGRRGPGGNHRAPGLVPQRQVQRGESVFVHGGTGGVGSCVVQMAKAAGAG